MKQEDKELLLKDLSIRVPYGVIVLEDIDKTFDGGCISELVTITEIKGEKMFLTKGSLTPVAIEEIRPYLRPISSMTEEEKKIFSAFGFEVIDHINANRDECPKYQVIEVSNFSEITKVTDWLNAHHFDYRGLIEKELALEAPNGMYK